MKNTLLRGQVMALCFFTNLKWKDNTMESVSRLASSPKHESKKVGVISN